MTNQIIKRNKR